MAIAWTIGVDGGGSGCRARVYDAALRPLGEGAAGPANLLLGAGADPVGEILAAIRAALAAAGLGAGALEQAALGVGVAGATPAGRARFFAAAPPCAQVRLLGDGHAAALGAHGGGDGGVAILGTGAVAVVLRGGAAREIGGWGFVADDLGSGADIGRRALRLALRTLDAAPGGQGGGPLAAAVLARRGGVGGALAEWSLTARPAEIAALAPLVFDAAAAGDAGAEAILADATAELERLVLLACAHGAGAVAALGSVGRRLAPRLGGAAAAALVPAQGDAALGAALAARAGLGWRA